MKEYTKEFNKMIIRIGHREANKEKFAWYINGLRTSNQEELRLVRRKIVE